MAILQQKTGGFTIYQGWYGLCDDSNTDCIDFPLVEGTLGATKKLYPEIQKIYEVRGDSAALISYDGTVPDGFGLHFATQALNKLKCGHCYRILLTAGESSVDIPSFTFANADTTEVKKITENCGEIIPSSTQELDFRCHVINGEEVLQVKNHLRPQHTNFITHDTTKWSTLYYFNPPHNSMTEDAYDLADPFWPDVAVSLDYLNDVNFENDCCASVVNNVTVSESSADESLNTFAPDGVTNLNSFVYGGEVCISESTGGSPSSVYLYLGDSGYQTEFPIGKIDITGKLSSNEINFKVTQNSTNGNYPDNLVGKCLKGVIEDDICRLYVSGEENSIIHKIVGDKVISLQQKNNDGYLQVYVDGKATFIFYGDASDTENSVEGKSEQWPPVYCEEPATPTPTPTPVPQPTPTPTPSPTPTDTPTPTPEPTPTPTQKTDNCIAKNITVQIVSQNGNKYAFGDTYHTPFKVNTGIYKLNIPSGHPIVLIGNNPSEVKLVGTDMLEGGYINDVELWVYSDFGTISYGCTRHGAMGGTNNLKFSEHCENGYEFPTPTPTPKPECCADFENTMQITSAIASGDTLTSNGITVGGFEEGASVCIDNVGTTSISNGFWFTNQEQSWFGQINTSRNIINNKIRYTAPDGKCYEGELNLQNGQFNILTEV